MALFICNDGSIWGYAVHLAGHQHASLDVWGRDASGLSDNCWSLDRGADLLKASRSLER
jgi:hypothetical protein